ncbi:MAG: hypothetical protein JJU33_11540 [Phycisphaerales bacterium]|nr:hypothetical protein [Phycisphaerales bacterium]
MIPFSRKHVDDLRRLYIHNDYPLDRLVNDPEAKTRFADHFNLVTGSDLTAEELCGFLLFLRKSKDTTGGLPRIGRRFHGPNI